MSGKSRSSTTSFPRKILHNGALIVDDTLRYTSLSQSIRSDSHPRYRRGSGMCEHSQIFRIHEGGSHTYYGGTSGTTDVFVATPVAAGVDSLAGSVLQPDGFDKEALALEAFRTMSPGMESGFSLTNFLVELGEVKQLWRLWNRNQGVIKNLAGANLNYHYGWKQTIRDVKQIYGRLTSFSNRLNALIAGQGQSQKRHFRKVLATSRATTESGFYAWGNDAIKCVYTYNAPMVFSATMTYRYTLPELSGAALKARALADHLGLKLSAKVVWDALPLSFVVDWFLGVGDFLGQFEDRWIEPQIQIIDFCCSAKYDASVKIYVRRNTLNPNNTTWAHSHTVRCVNYARWTTLPNVSAMKALELNDKAWDASRYSLAASLVVQRL